ncbi:hypothetical protein BC940DRAFT_349125 [Gongronella butleri]|nr:hypothetical protein BC940DRAFT_349125 [Gongronella butleri]
MVGDESSGKCTCASLFEPAALSAEDHRGFRLLLPHWDTIRYFNRPSVREVKRMLGKVELSAITEDVVRVARGSMASSPYVPSRQQFDASSVDSHPSSNEKQARNLAIGDKDNENEPLRSGSPEICTPHGARSVAIIFGVSQYIKGLAVTAAYHPEDDPLLFYRASGFLDTPLHSVLFSTVPGATVAVQQSIEALLKGSVADGMAALQAAEQAIGFSSPQRHCRDFFTYMDLGRVFARTRGALQRGDSGHNGMCVSAMQQWMTGDLQRSALTCLIAQHLFDYPLAIPQQPFYGTIKDALIRHVFGERLHDNGTNSSVSSSQSSSSTSTREAHLTFPKRHVSLKQLVDKEFTLDIRDEITFGVSGYDLVIGKFSYSQMRVARQLCTVDGDGCLVHDQLTDILHIYSGLLATPDSVKLAFRLGIIDCDHYTTIKHLLPVCRGDVHSTAGAQYAHLSRQFFHWTFRLKTDFTNSLTHDAFSVLVTITAIILSFTGIISVVQNFVPK